MANRAAKKEAQRAQTTNPYFNYLLGFTILHLVGIFYSLLFTKNFQIKDLLIFIACGYIGFSSCNSIRKSLILGIGYSNSQDLFILNCAAQALLTFTRWGWVIYLVIPIYLSRGCFQMLFGFLGKDYNKQDEKELDPREAKKLEKKQKNEGRVKYKTVKRG